MTTDSTTRRSKFGAVVNLAVVCLTICGAVILTMLDDGARMLTIDDLPGFPVLEGRVPRFQLNSLDSAADSSLLLSRFGNKNAPPRLFMLKSRGTTFGNAAAVQSGDQLGELRWLAADGRNFHTIAADIDATVYGAVSINRVPTRLDFRTRDATGRIAVRTSILPGGALLAGDGSSGVDPGSEGLLVEGKFAMSSGSLIIGSGGAVTVATNMAVIDTQAGASSDDLDTINGGVNGMPLYVRAANDERTVVIKSGTGNIHGAADCPLDNRQDIAHFVFNSALNAWLVVACSNNGA